MLTDAVGYIASALVLMAFSTNSMLALRILAVSSNVVSAAYGILADLDPVLLLHCVLLPINLYKIWQCACIDHRMPLQADAERLP